MRNKVLTIVALQSAAIFIVATFFWIRGYMMTDDIEVYTTGRFTRFKTSGGGFWFETRPWPTSTATRYVWNRFDTASYVFKASASAPTHERVGFMWSTLGYDLLLVAPYWAVVFPALAITATGLVVTRGQFRIRTLLILMTIVSMLAAAIVAVCRYQSEKMLLIVIGCILVFLGAFALSVSFAFILFLIQEVLPWIFARTGMQPRAQKPLT